MKVTDTIQIAIVDFVSGELCQERAETLLTWIGQNDENRTYFSDLAKIWYATGTISSSGFDPETALTAIVDSKNHGSRIRRDKDYS